MKRRKGKRWWLCLAAALLLGMLPVQVTQAKTDVTVKAGVYAGDIALEGMTQQEACAAISAYIDGLYDVEITLLAAGGSEVVVTAGELGISWANEELVQEALLLGNRGNVVERYKALEDLRHENKIYPIELEFDIGAIDEVLTQKCAVFDQPAVDADMRRENGEFVIEAGQTGYLLDVETSIDTIYDFLTTEWDRDTCSVELDIVVSEPRGKEEDLTRIKDVLGTYTTSFSTSNFNRSANVANGCRLINGTLLYPGDEFSCYDTVSPFSESNGYYMAGSYLNGQVVDSLGGGICQVSTTLYNAVLLSELEVTERNNHSMIVSYVPPSADAAIAESSGKDFRFINSTDYPIYIEGFTTSDKHITFTIYGVETRPEGHKVVYESEVLETIQPDHDNIYADVTRPIGYISVTSSAHIGYKARLWKIVTENGVEVSREVINSSSYKVSPRSVSVGVSTEDVQMYNDVMAAINTGSLDYVRQVVALLQASAAEAPAQ